MKLELTLHHPKHGELTVVGEVSDRIIDCSEGSLSLLSAMQDAAYGLMLELAGQIMAERRESKGAWGSVITPGRLIASEVSDENLSGNPYGLGEK